MDGVKQAFGAAIQRQPDQDETSWCLSTLAKSTGTAAGLGKWGSWRLSVINPAIYDSGNPLRCHFTPVNKLELYFRRSFISVSIDSSASVSYAKCMLIDLNRVSIWSQADKLRQGLMLSLWVTVRNAGMRFM